MPATTSAVNHASRAVQCGECSKDYFNKLAIDKYNFSSRHWRNLQTPFRTAITVDILAPPVRRPPPVDLKRLSCRYRADGMTRHGTRRAA